MKNIINKKNMSEESDDDGEYDDAEGDYFEDQDGDDAEEAFYKDGK